MNNGGAVLKDTTTPATSPNWGAALTTDGGVVQFKPSGGTAVTQYFFQGWKNVPLESGNFPTDPIKAKLPSPEFGQVLASPTAGDNFNPGTGAFSITARLKPYGYGTSKLLPGASSAPDYQRPSYNVIQKGRSDSTGGYWKMSIMGFDDAKWKKGSVSCTFKNSIGEEASVYSYDPTDARNTFTFAGDNMQNYTEVTCRRGADGSLKVITRDFRGVTRTVTAVKTVLGTIAPAAGPGPDYGSYVTLGKKPGSDVSADAYAGHMDYVKLVKG